ncbi:Pr6Pr family membrane protein [Streptococcus macacae]|uniref:Pr6Pr family membrane protein n=1 Tax=Streptococcus macacae TaxID=1339 RepID=UPI0005935DF6|nr:Pr6Pr family membrane protein [Streptococcus macacae]
MTKTQIFRSFIALLGIIGVSIQIKQSGFGMLLYYTTLSNVLVFSFLIYLIYKEAKSGAIKTDPKLLRLKGGITMAIMITFLVYHFLLAPRVKAHDYYTLRNFLVHYIVPLSLMVDTLILDRQRIYRWFDPITWTSLPLIYFAFALFNGLVLKWTIPGSADNPFPYFFININKYGVGYVAVNTIGIAIAYLAVGYLFLFIKRYVGPHIK